MKTASNRWIRGRSRESWGEAATCGLRLAGDTRRCKKPKLLQLGGSLAPQVPSSRRARVPHIEPEADPRILRQVRGDLQDPGCESRDPGSRPSRPAPGADHL